MGFDDECARGLIRVSLGRFNTQQEVDRFIKIFVGAVSSQQAGTGGDFHTVPPLHDTIAMA